MKIRPCDCKSTVDALKMNEQGVAHNENSIMVKPNTVEMKMGHTTIKIPMSTFKLFAEWYLEEQEFKEIIKFELE